MLVTLFLVHSSLNAQSRPPEDEARSARSAAAEVENGDRSPMHFNLNFLPWRKESAARQSLEAAVERSRPKAAPAPVARSSSYLATGGSIPLRFSAPRAWPSRMAPTQEKALAIALAPDPDVALRRQELLAQNDAGVAAVPKVVSSDASAAQVTTVSSAQADEDRGPQVVHRPLLYGAGEAILTSDLVLRALDGLGSERGAVPGNFRPAVPKESQLDSVPLATAP